MPDDARPEPRLDELELRYTEQQRLLQELSDVVYAQQRELDSLRAELTSLRSRVAAAEDLPSIGAAERPPHH